MRGNEAFAEQVIGYSGNDAPGQVGLLLTAGIMLVAEQGTCTRVELG